MSWVAVHVTVAAFATYACMYAFRKPITAATFSGQEFGGIDLKVLAVIAQIMGYTASKFIGISVVSGMPQRYRALAILAFIGIAELGLLGFALAPFPYNVLFMILNGLPLGMIWGLVFSFVEGRRLTELIGLGLSVSFIISSGLVKSIGLWVMASWGVSEYWMPFVVGLLALPLLGTSVWALSKVAPPTEEEQRATSVRKSMTSADRAIMLRGIGIGMVVLTALYALLSIYRDLRDTFMVDILTELGYVLEPALLTQTELLVASGVLCALATVVIVRDHGRALVIYHVIFLAAITLIGASTLLMRQGVLSPIAWIVCTGLGVYGAYVPFNSILFDRVLSAFRYTGTAAFLIYVADAYGYLGSASLYVLSNTLGDGIRWVDLFMWCSSGITIIGPILVLTSLFYFVRKHGASHVVVSGVALFILLGARASAHDGHDPKHQRVFEWILHPSYTLPGNAPSISNTQYQFEEPITPDMLPLLHNGRLPSDRLQPIQSRILNTTESYAIELWTCNHVNKPVAASASLIDTNDTRTITLLISTDTLLIRLGDKTHRVVIPRGHKRYWHHLVVSKSDDVWYVYADAKLVVKEVGWLAKTRHVS